MDESSKEPVQAHCSGGRVQAVDRALTLLETLAETEHGLRLTDISRRTRISLTTAHRLLTTLQHRRFVHFSQATSTWHVGLQAFAVGSTFGNRRNLATSALPFMRHLRDRTKETVNLGIVEEGTVILVAQVPSLQISKSIAVIGGRTPILASGMGKAILSSYSLRDFHGVVRKRGLHRFTGSTLTSVDVLTEQIGRARVDGFALDDGEFITGLRCVAAPIHDEMAEVVGAISISSTSTRMSDERLPALGRLVAYAASEITAALSGKARPH